MTIDTFLCDTCNKAIDVTDNPSGITMLPRCVITQNCRGSLSQVDKIFVNEGQYNNLGVDTNAWVQRPLLYNHDQSAPRRNWVINHGLGSQPILLVYVFDVYGKLTPLSNTQYTVVNNGTETTTISFNLPYTGQVQCMIRASAASAPASTPVTSAPLVSLTPNNTLVVASRLPPNTQITLIVNTTPQQSITLYLTNRNGVATPWVIASYVIINNLRYPVYALDLRPLSVVSSAITSVYVSAANGNPIARGQIYALLTNSPSNDASDCILNNVLDLVDISSATSPAGSISSGILYCTPDSLTLVYPNMEIGNE